MYRSIQKINYTKDIIIIIIITIPIYSRATQNSTNKINERQGNSGKNQAD